MVHISEVVKRVMADLKARRRKKRDSRSKKFKRRGRKTDAGSNSHAVSMQKFLESGIFK
jgi:hypothetical protein